MKDNILVEVLRKLRFHGQSLAVAESLTAGALGKAITEIAGASDVFLGGVIAYSKSAKVNQLSVSAQDIEKFGLVSKEVAIAMAEGVRDRFEATWSLSTTGIAGPSAQVEIPAQRQVPAGKVWVALAGPASLKFISVAKEFNFGDIGRGQVRDASVHGALTLLDITLGALEQ